MNSQLHRDDVLALYEDIALLKVISKRSEERMERVESKVDVLVYRFNRARWTAKILSGLLVLGAAACAMAEFAFRWHIHE